MIVEARIRAAAIPKARKKPLRMGRLFVYLRLASRLTVLEYDDFGGEGCYMREDVPIGVVIRATQGGDASHFIPELDKWGWGMREVLLVGAT